MNYYIEEFIREQERLIKKELNKKKGTKSTPKNDNNTRKFKIL